MDSKTLSAIVSNFSFKFLNELEKTKNAVCSPLSAEFVLALLTLGTDDLAHSELLASLGLPDDDTIRSSFSAVSTKLKSIKGITLNVANKVYIKKGSYDLNPQLEDDAVKIFDAAMEKVDFNDSACIKKINTWVEKKTNKKIKNLLSKDSVDDDTRLILVNALYFKSADVVLSIVGTRYRQAQKQGLRLLKKIISLEPDILQVGTWKNKFKRSKTKKKTFHLNANSTVDIPMMYREDTYCYGYSEHLQAKLLILPYLGNGASMLIVLPQEIEGLNSVLAQLANGYDVMLDVEEMRERRNVEVTIPKFKIETKIDLKELLPKLGIKAIFDRSYLNLTKILSNNEPLYVSTAVQKAFIEVTEEGTEAAAATQYTERPLCKSPRFYADRPFLYSLMDADRMPLFVGVYRGPI